MLYLMKFIQMITKKPVKNLDDFCEINTYLQKKNINKLLKYIFNGK